MSDLRRPWVRRGELGRRVQRLSRHAPWLSTNAIAERVGCSPDTVRQHRYPEPRLRSQPRGEDLHDDFRLTRRRMAADRWPPGVLARLAADPDCEVRREVARNEMTPGRLLARLAADSDEFVQFRVAARHGCPVQLLLRLARSDDEAVASAAAKQLAEICAYEDARF